MSTPAAVEPPRPSAIRIFLIADIRGYTRFTDEFGDEAASRLASVFAQIVAEAMAAWGGQLIELRGDEALCTFESPRAALRCAIELQQIFAEEAVQSEQLPLRVGMGLDLGEAVPVGDGFRGAALNIAARLCAGAAAGEIRTTTNLAHVAGPIPGLRFEPQGSEQLKGIAGDVSVMLVRPSSESGFPARTATTPEPGRSPEPLPGELESTIPLFGRRDDVLWLRWYWRRARLGHGHVVEVVGPPGMGKTRLVSELAQLAHAEGAIVRLASDASPVPAADATRHPIVSILDDADRHPVSAIQALEDLETTLAGLPHLVVLTRSDDASPPSRTRPRRQLQPLSEPDTAEIAALYATDGLEEPPVRRITSESRGLPREVHRLASQWARATAKDRMTESARRTSRERRGLREAEAELIGRYADLEMTRERTRRYGNADGEAAAHGNAVCPYKGLAAYEAADADYYFGREQLVGELVARVVGSSFVGLVGASGSGKSSVLSAGLLPALADGVLPGSGEWIQVPMRPGAQPMRQLAAALRRADPDTAAEEADAQVLLEQLIGRMGPAQRLLLVIDQFEEAFSADEAERDRFIELVAEGRPGLKVVVAVRADQYERCAAYPRLARQLASVQVLVGPLRSEEVAAIVRHPAERVGLSVEPELVDALIADLGTEPGAMPLLSTALLELWEAREDGRLTLAAHRATGGVRGAVARLAESAYARLDPEEQEAARTLFMRLIGEGSEPETIVRRRLSNAEIETMGDPHIGSVVEQLTAGRLLTRDEGTVEVAHEALIREWPRLRDWIEADAAGRHVRLHLIGAARTWDAGGREDGDLYRGARLAAGLDWAAAHAGELNAVERDFLEGSRASAERAAERQKRTNRILRGLLAGAGVLLLAAIGAGAVAWVQAGQNAVNASVAQVRELSLTAQALIEDDPELAILIAAEAVNLSQQAGRTPPPEALKALWSAYVADRTIVTVEAGALAVAYSPDGSELAVDAPERTDVLVTLRDVTTGEEVGELGSSAEQGEVRDIAYSPTGDLIAVAMAGPSGAGGGVVHVFDADSRAPVRELSNGHDAYDDLSYNASGLLAAAGSTDGERGIDLVVWDPATDDQAMVISETPAGDITIFPQPLTLSGALHPQADELVIGGTDELEWGLAQLVGTSVGPEARGCDSCPIRPSWAELLDIVPDLVAPSPTGDRVAVAELARGLVVIIEVATAMPTFDPVTHQGPQALTWNSEGTTLAVSGSQSGVILLDAETGNGESTIPVAGGQVASVEFRPGADEIAIVSTTGELRVLSLSPRPGDVAAGPGQRAVAVTDAAVMVSVDRDLTETDMFLREGAAAGGSVTIHDRDTGNVVGNRPFLVNARVHAQVAKDANQMAGIYTNGSAVVTDLESVREVSRLPGCTSSTGISPDARYVVVDGSVGGVACVETAVGGIYDVAASELLIEYESDLIPHAAVSNPAGPGGARYAALAAVTGRLARLDIWDVDSQSLLASIDEEMRPGFRPAHLAFSSDARYLAVGTNSPRTLVVDVAALADGASFDEALVFDRETHASMAPKAILTDDGMVATSGGEGIYRFWNLESGEMTMELEAIGLLGSGMFDFSPDFGSFYYEDGGGIIRHMPVDIDEMIEQATSSVGRTLTDDECRTYLRMDSCPPTASR